MEAWKIFELNCTEYLNKVFGNNFHHLGFNDSTVSDIRYDDGLKSFYIEAKMPSAQSGQFVLHPDEEKGIFEFSSRNKSKMDENVAFIIDYMNDNFEKYATAGTKGLEIDLPQELFGNWITSTYRQSGVEFFITKGDDYIIFPIEKYVDYFNISATFREKRSGTNKLPKIHHQLAKIKIKHLYTNAEFSTDVKNELFVQLNDKLISNIISLEDFDLYLSHIGNRSYKVKKRSNTKNSNVIFSIKLIKNQSEEDLQSFIDRIK